MEKNRIPKYIAIEGPIGVGKTSLAKQISQEFGHELCLEKPDENPFLNSFYENTQKYAFATQMHFVMQRSQQINMYFSDDLIEKPIVSDFIFQKEDLFAELNLSADELNIFKEIKTKFYETFPKPDLLIYLQASPKQIFERVRKRGRTYEDSISLNYLEDVCEKYAEFFFNYSESPLLVLNVDNVDFMANKLDLARVIDCLKKEIVGKEFINLAPGFFLMEINITKLEQTEAFGKAIASFLVKSNDFNIIYLDGNLGAGKTTLVRSILKALGWSGAVKSPTFSILEEYHINGIDIFHTDLYRLDGQNDFDMLGLEINQNKRGILFVEWPEKIEKFGIGNEIYIKLEDKIECRLAKISSDNQDFLGSIDGIELNNPV